MRCWRLRTHSHSLHRSAAHSIAAVPECSVAIQPFCPFTFRVSLPVSRPCTAVSRSMSSASSASPPLSVAPPVVAVLYQSTAPPPIDGLLKPLKPGGYSDSSADVAAALARAGISIVTPSQQPSEEQPTDWIWGDSEQQIQSAVQAGATVLWANTVLHARHALMTVQAAKNVRLVGHAPQQAESGDDKFDTNRRLAQHAVPVARAVLVSDTATSYHSQPVLPLTSFLSSLPFSPPAVVKPVRGRGSQGVAYCSTADSLAQHVQSLLSQRDVYGDVVMVEEWLSGEEITVTVLPPGQYDAPIGQQSSHWTLPVVRRTGHVNGIAPYNGVVAVALNSVAVNENDEPDTIKRAAYAAIRGHCATVGGLLNVVACLRIDCRANEAGEFVLFDLNMKPNMTGPGRIGREQQTSLVGLAAGAIGWSYEQLCVNLLRQARPLAELQKL